MASEPVKKPLVYRQPPTKFTGAGHWVAFEIKSQADGAKLPLCTRGLAAKALMQAAGDRKSGLAAILSHGLAKSVAEADQLLM